MDPSSAAELLGQTQSSKPKPVETAKPRPVPDTSKYNTEIQNSSQYYTDEKYCKSHPDEEVKYFCFDCLTPPICSECVIHGIHKNHEVMHIKKGFPVVKGKLEEVIQGLMTCIDGLDSDKRGLLSKKQIITNQAEDAKAQLNTIMEDLITRITKKQSELIRHIDAVSNDALKELDSYDRTIEDKMSTLSNNVKFIQEHMDSGPLATLNFYSDNNKLLVQVSEQEAPQNYQYIACEAQTNLVSSDGIVRDTKEAAARVTDAIGQIGRAHV